MTDDVRLSVTLRNHRKTKRLRRRLGAEACWSLVCLFLFAGEQRWTGELTGLTAEDIEDEADWQGEPGAFVLALLDLGFLDVDGEGTFAIHDWAEHNPFAATKGQRIEKGRKAADARWSKARDDARSMPGACNEHAGSNAQSSDAASEQCPPAPAPAPTPTQPSTGNVALQACAADADAHAHDDRVYPDGFEPAERQPATPSPYAPFAIALNSGGFRCTSMTPSLIAYADAGGSVDHLLELMRQERFYDGGQPKAAKYLLTAAIDEVATVVTVQARTETAHARAGPCFAPSKSAMAIQSLEALKSGSRLAAGRNPDRAAEALHALPGPNAGR